MDPAAAVQEVEAEVRNPAVRMLLVTAAASDETVAHHRFRTGCAGASDQRSFAWAEGRLGFALRSFQTLSGLAEERLGPASSRTDLGCRLAVSRCWLEVVQMMSE